MSLIGFCAALLLATQASSYQDEKSNKPPQIVPTPVFPQLFRTHTGKNAMEEYVLAVDELQGIKLDLAYQQYRATGPDRVNTYLQSARRLVEASGKCYEFIVAGNALPYSDPRVDMDFNTKLSELTGFRAVGHVFAAKMSVEFADGRQAAAFETFVNGMRYSDKFGRRLLISGLVSSAVQGVLLDRMYWLLPYLSLAQCESTIKLAQQMLSGTDMLAEAMLSESGPLIRSLEQAMRDPNGATAEYFNSFIDSDSSEALRKTTTPERIAIIKEVIPIYRTYYQKIAEELKKPESTWSLPAMSSENALVLEFAEYINASYEQVFANAKRNRTRLRLMRLHAAIRQFRHENGSLPPNLKALPTTEWTLDPVTGGQFHYELRNDRTYDLYSDGDAATGQIDLRGARKNPTQDDKNPDEPRPPLCW